MFKLPGEEDQKKLIQEYGKVDANNRKVGKRAA